MAAPVPFYGRAGLHVDCYDSFHRAFLEEAGDAAWYAARAREWGGPVLEGASGTGRVSFAMARAGAEVVGFDRSAAMRERAEAQRAALPAEVAARTAFVAGDLRDFDLRRTFPLAVVPFRAFQSLLEPAEQEASLARFRHHLVPGGRLVLALFDPVYAYLLPGARSPTTRSEVRHPSRGTPVTVEIGEREVDPLRQVLREEWVFTERDGEGRAVLEERETLTMRWTFRYEMRHLLARCGFELEAEYSDFRGSPPAYGKEQVFVARRPG